MPESIARPRSFQASALSDQPGGWNWPDHSRHPVKSLTHAIETGTAPVCSGEDGRWAVEMVAAVYESQRTRARVRLPLRNRSNPLVRL